MRAALPAKSEVPPLHRRHGRARSLLIALVAIIATLPAAARAADGDPFLDQCLSSGTVASCTDMGGPTLNAIDVELSPDGNQLYALSYSPASIRVFDRGAFNKLTPRTGAALRALVHGLHPELG